MKITHITIATLASTALLLTSCVVTPVNGYSNLSLSTDGHSVGVAASVGWTNASYDVNGFPIYGYYNGRPVYGYTSTGAAIFTIAALTALCFVPDWGPAPWYCGHWHYPPHIHRVAAPPRVCHGHYPTRRPAGGLHAPIHHHGPSHGAAHRPNHGPSHGAAHRPNHGPNHGAVNRPNHTPNRGMVNRPSHTPNRGMVNRPSHTPNRGTVNRPSYTPNRGTVNRPSHAPNHSAVNRPSHTPNRGMVNRPSHSARTNISVPRTPSASRVSGATRPAGFSRGSSPSRNFGGGARGGGRRR